MQRDQVVLELQMLTGIVSNDLQYLYNQLVSSNKPEKVEDSKPEFVNNIVNEEAVEEPSLDDWFSNL